MKFIYEVAIFRCGRKENSVYFEHESKAKKIMNEVIDIISNERRDLEIIKNNDCSVTFEFKPILDKTTIMTLNKVISNTEYAKVVLIMHPLLD